MEWYSRPLAAWMVPMTTRSSPASSRARESSATPSWARSSASSLSHAAKNTAGSGYASASSRRASSTCRPPAASRSASAAAGGRRPASTPRGRTRRPRPRCSSAAVTGLSAPASRSAAPSHSTCRTKQDRGRGPACGSRAAAPCSASQGRSARGHGVDRRGPDEPVRTVEERRQAASLDRGGRLYEAHVVAQQHRRGVREEGAAEGGRARDAGVVQGQGDRELLRAVPAQHRQLPPGAAEPGLLRRQEAADGGRALRPAGCAGEAQRPVLRTLARPYVLDLPDGVVRDQPRPGLDHRPGAAVVGQQQVGRGVRRRGHTRVELEDASAGRRAATRR